MTDEQIFVDVIALPETERALFLEKACGDAEQRRRLEALVVAHEQPDSLFEKDDLPPTAEGSNRVAIGTTVGHYKLREQIGEGGMGSVFVAEQQRPVRRMVALKLIKTGMDTKDVIARFEAERQALAMMDHPNIAKVLDAGTTETGRPYFVMELVRGIPITQYCDEQKLNIRQRLELFTQVCRAIQHAHQKGIIHRDIKPSNVLVTEHDGQPVPKVIDFGVAKAIGHRLTEQTIYTHHLQPVGTLLYMSPEQSRLSGLDIDTRSDVYSLGLLLYELLTGTMPFDRETFDKASFDEKRRIIAEDEAPRPSTRISTLGHTTSTVTETRRTDAVALQKELRGELDWILIKALEKDRNRRYDSPNHLAGDVSNYLTGEIVQARPPSRTYQLQKLYRKNRAVVTGAAAVIALLIASLGAVSWGWQTARQLAGELVEKTRTLKEQRQMLEEKTEKLSERNATLQAICIDRAIGDALSGNIARARLSIDQAREAETEESILDAIGGLADYFSGNANEAMERLRQTTNSDPTNIAAWSVLFLASEETGDYGRMNDCRTALQSLQPRTNWDLMFRAMTILYSDPKLALADLDKLADANKGSAILGALRAIALLMVGDQNKDLNRIQESLDEFQKADSTLPSTRFIESNHLLALSLAIRLAKWRNDTPADSRDEEIAAWSSKGRLIATSLESQATSLNYTNIATFYSAIGDQGKIREITEKGSNVSPLPLQVRAAEMFASKQYTEDWRKLTSEFPVIEAFWRIEEASSKDERIAIANSAFEDVFFNEHDTHKLLALDMYLLIGEPKLLVDRAKRLKDSSPVFEWFMWDRTLELYVNPTIAHENDYLRDAEPSPPAMSLAYYVGGMLALSRGERSLAIDRFRICTSQGRLHSWSHIWPEAFLKRMEADITWPHWIQPKQAP